MESGNNAVCQLIKRRRGLGFIGSAAAAAVLLTAATGRAALIVPIAASDVPISSSASVFDASNTANTYSLGPGNAFIPAGFDVRDLFGGSFGTFGPEQNDVLFADNQPIGAVESINVTLASPVSLSSFSLFMEDDGTGGQRSCREFLLYSGGQLIDDVSLLDTSGSESYTSVYGSNYLQISDSFAELSPSADYTLDFVQNQPAAGDSGMRALEFQATGISVLAAVPEPPSATGFLIATAGSVLRRRRDSKSSSA
jgi:hypothetical protein